MIKHFVNAANRPRLTWPVAALLLAAGVSRPAAGQNFATTRTDYATAPGPNQLAVADVNGDGRPDLVTANSGDNTVSVRLAAGATGGFATARVDYPGGRGCLSVAVADVNADGRPDLITAHYNDNTVGIRLAAGPAGDFAATRTDYATSNLPNRVTVADVNADGRPDLLVLTANDVGVRLAAGAAGTFAATRASYPTGGNSFGLAVADVNADGRPDLLTTDVATSSVGVRLADAAVPGAFAATRTDYATGTFPLGVVAADVNADGRPDLLTANLAGASVSVRLADAATPGAFAATASLYPTGNTPRRLAVADVNADGRPDLVTVHESDNTVGIRLAAGPAGAFAATRTDYATGRTPYDVALADVNADGRPDLLALSTDGNSVSVRLNTGTLATGVALAATPLALCPNPVGAGGGVRVTLPAVPAAPVTAAVFDALGRAVLPVRTLPVASGQATGTLPTTGLLPGLYLVQLSSGAATATQRLVVE